jgi:hypothetical protein
MLRLADCCVCRHVWLLLIWVWLQLQLCWYDGCGGFSSFVAVAMASLALAKRPFAAAKHYISFCLFLLLLILKKLVTINVLFTFVMKKLVTV